MGDTDSTEINQDILTSLDDLGRPDGRVAVVGSMNVDYTIATHRLPQPGETVRGGTLRLLPGGKSGNQAVAAALLGARVGMFGAVGDDSNAQILLSSLTKAGVDTSSILRTHGQSGLTVITVDDEARNTIVYSPGSNAQAGTEYVLSQREALTGASVLGLCLESPVGTVAACARMCHEAGVTVLLNDSPFLPTADLPAELIDSTDVLLVNEIELAQLIGVALPQHGDWKTFGWGDALGRLVRLGFGKVIVTLGGDGSVVLDVSAPDAQTITHIDPVSVNPVDTTGCGDAFMGTILAGLAGGLSLVASARLASAVSAYVATGRGAQASYGTAEQIRAFLGE